MADSVLAVVSRGLAKLGEPRLTSLAEGTATAITVRDLLPGLRQDELRKHPWCFALRRARLAALATAPAWGWAFAYQLPTDCLPLLLVGDTLESGTSELVPPAVAYQLEGRQILTNAAAPLPIRYIADAPDAGAWDAAFAEALACRLAVELCERVTQSASRRQALRVEHRDAVKEARRCAAIEQLPMGLPEEGPWLRARW